MRNKTMRRSLSMARLMMLALCFVMAFTVAFVLLGEANLNANAADKVRVYAGDSYSGSNVQPDNYGLSAYNTGLEGLMGYGTKSPTVEDGVKTWNIGTITFNDFVIDKSNFSSVVSYGSQYPKEIDTAPYPERTTNGNSNVTIFKMKFKDDNSVSLVFNIALPQYLQNILSGNEEFEMTFDAQIDVSRGENTTREYKKARAKIATASTSVSASNTDLTGSNQGGGQKDGDSKYGYKSNSTSNGYNNGSWNSSAWNNSTLSFSSLKLNKSTPYIYVCIGIGDSEDCEVAFKDLKLTNVKITKKVVADSATVSRSDGAAPIVLSKYDSSVSDSFYPYRTDAKTAGTGDNAWEVWHDNLTGKLSKAVDSVKDGNGSLKSYTNTAKTFEGKEYYKSSSITYQDAYNYLSGNMYELDSYTSDKTDVKPTAITAKLAKDIDENYAAGIKRVLVGDEYQKIDDTTSAAGAVFNLYEMNAGTSVEKTIYVDGEAVGWTIVTKDSRSQVVVNTYIYKNATVITRVTDYGESSNTFRITYSGIDTTAPNADTYISSEDYVYGEPEIYKKDDNGDYIKGYLDWTQLDWLRDEVLVADAENKYETGQQDEDSSDPGYSPYIWFYTVDKADNYNGFGNKTTFDNYDKIKAAGLNPIACGEEISEFKYDFSTGYAKGFGGDPQGVQDGEPGPTGAGYYRFTFYVCDLAGNMRSETTSFYVKVDYDDPTYTLDFTYGNGNKITNKENGKWATDDIVITLTLTNGGFSGYTLAFEIDEERHALVVDGYGELAREINNVTRDEFVSALVKYVPNEGDPQDVTGNTVTIKDLPTSVGTRDVEIKYSHTYGKDDAGKDVQSRVFTFTIKAETNKNFAWITPFIANGGQYTDSIEISDLEGTINKDWGYVNILLDSTAPTTPTMSDGEDADNVYVNQFGGYTSLPANRVWYTESTAFKNFPVILGFTDDIVTSDYASDLTVYYAFKHIDTLADLNALGNNAIPSKIQELSVEQLEEGKYFTKLVPITGDNFDEGSANLAVDLIAGNRAGMRVFYVWAEDQAGNKSSVSTYYVLADPTQYSVSTSVNRENGLDRNSANISFTDANGEAASVFKRGEKVVLTIGLENGYAPLSLKMNGELLLENYTPQKAWTAMWTDNDGNLVSEPYISTKEYSSSGKIEYVLDDPDNISQLASQNSFEFAHRKVVSYTITNSQVSYTAAPTDVFANTYFSDIESKGEFNYVFYDKDNNVLASAPTSVGSYFVALYIPKDSNKYVTDDFAMDKDGKQTLDSVAYQIVKGTAVITATPTVSVYGDDPTLTFTVSGIDRDKLASEGIEVVLALRGETGANGKYAAGSYQIVCNSKWNNIKNYNVVFESAMHIVTQREVYVYALAASKSYKNVDPELRFGVKLADFDETTQNEIFAGYRQDENAGLNDYVVYFADGRLSRESGESVGKYSYIDTTNKFDVNSNYRVVLQTNDVFEIKQRVVTLDVSGQSVFAFGETFDLSQIAPSYTLEKEDLALASEIAALNIKLSLGAQSANQPEKGDYDSATAYTVVLGSDASDDIKVVIGENSQYIVYVTAENTIIVRAKEGVVFSGIYGLVRGNGFTLPYSADKFEIVGTPSGDVVNITWSASISSDADFIDAGNYTVTFSGARLVGSDGELQDKVVVEQVSYTVNQANIVVKPTVQNLAKTYGDEDSVYGIGFEIVTVAGFTPEQIAQMLSFDVNNLKSVISGAYARAIFAKGGKRLAYATKYDTATQNGVIVGTDGRYYGIEIGTAFSSTNTNFTVEATLDNSIKLSIDAKQIKLGTKDLVGIGKYYDGTTDVHYGTSAMFDIASYLVRTQDDVALSANAVYSEAGSASANKTVYITFDNFVLVGDDALNYVLVGIENNGKDTQVGTINGENKFESLTESYNAISNEIVVRINYIDNEKGTGIIEIKPGYIDVVKSDIVVSKQYDNTGNITSADITFKSGDGTILLANNKNMVVVEGSIGGVSVGSNYLISTLKIFFPFGSEIDIKNDPISYKDKYQGIEVYSTTYGDNKGVMLVVTTVSAKITQRVIDADSFSSITAVNREYNSTTTVDIEYVLDGNALAAGDQEKAVGLLLVGASDDKNAGKHPVKLTSWTVSDDNYTVDLDSIQSRFNAIDVTISKATLVPVVEFDKKVYDGKSDIAYKNLSGKFTTTWAINLKTELEWISFDTSKVEFKLSLNGEENANVQADQLHNVMVSGMTIKFADSLTQEQKDELEKNYKLAGSRYSAANGKYTEITDLEEGEVKAYELIDFVTVEPKPIVLTNNDFKIADKIYDGSKKANISVPITEDSEGNQRLVDASHADMLAVTAAGEFEEKDARDNIHVTIFKESIELQATNEAGLAIINNYVLVLSYDAQVTGNIKPRPVAVNVDFGEQVYNGDELVNDGGIDYGTPDGVLKGDKNGIVVYTDNKAYYDNKNVEYVVEKDENGNDVKVVATKSGTAYGVRLESAKNNYTAVYASETLLEGKTLVAYVTTSGDWVFASTVNKEDDGNVAYYCYDLETTKDYIYVASTDKVARAKAENAIVGTYFVGEQKVYMLTSNHACEADGSLDAAITYLRGKGVVTQREVTMKASGIQHDEEFSKVYDGTKKFYGEYTITASALDGVVAGDEVLIKNVSAEYESENSGTPKVVFNISEIEGDDVGNYKISGNTALQVRKDGKIEPISIKATLADGEREYGDTSVPNAITYSIVSGENEYKLSVYGDKKLFMNYTDFLVLTGLDKDVDGYKETLDARRYNLVDDEYVKAEDGSLILLGGSNDTISSLPVANATKAILSAGTTTNCTISSGKATNYKFVPEYTGENGSELRIVKKQLYVFTETRDFAKNYGTSNPEVTLIYKDKNGADGIVSGDQWTTLFKMGSKDYRPVVKLGVFKDGTITPLTSLEKISTDVDGYYVFYLDCSEFESIYKEIENYEVHAAGYDNVFVNSDGKAAFKIDGYAQSHVASTLAIALPELTGISVGSNEENVFTYKKDYNWIGEVLRGELLTDVVTFIIGGENVAAINVGTYEGIINVERYINANGDYVSKANADANGYCIKWNSGETKVKITVNKQTINMWTQGASVYFNGSKQSYTGEINHTQIEDETDINDLREGIDYVISYEKYDSESKKYVPTDSVVVAGNYHVIVKFADNNKNGIADFEEAHPNLAAGKDIKADFSIRRAIVQISNITLNGKAGDADMLENEAVTKLTAIYSTDANYSIDYNVEMDERSDDERIALDKTQLTLVLKKNGSVVSLDNLTEAGKYTFSIVIADDAVLGDNPVNESNYVINGGKGVLELMVKHIEDANGNALDFGDNAITANKLVVTEIGKGTTTGNDLTYLTIVEQHVAAMSAQAETPARIVALYRVSLRCDDKIVTPNGTITVSVAMPDELDSLDGIVLYTVTEEGGLQKLTDYRVENGKVVYSTDHVSGIVFVDTNPEGLASWIIYTIVAVIAFIVLVVVATVVAIVIRKSRLKKLD